jgi:hypothetical protein
MAVERNVRQNHDNDNTTWWWNVFLFEATCHNIQETQK